MNHLVNLFRTENLETVCRIPVGEVLLQTASLSRWGQIAERDTEACIRLLKANGKRVLLDFGIPVGERQLETLRKNDIRILRQVDAVRFADPGVGAWLAERYPKVDLQLSLESGSFNGTAIERWTDIFGPALRRVVLSNQIPMEELKSIAQKVPVETELLGCGRIEVFHSARKLVRDHFQQDGDSPLELTCASEDRPTQFMPLLENRHGTILFHDRDLYILDLAERLSENGIRHLRLELYADDLYERLAECFPRRGWEEELRKRWGRRTTRGFVLENKTETSLKNLANRFLKAERENGIGVVLESVKNRHIVFELIQPLLLPAKLAAFSPEGKRVDFKLSCANNLLGESFTGRIAPGHYRIPWIKHIVPAAILTRPDRTPRRNDNHLRREQAVEASFF